MVSRLTVLGSSGAWPEPGGACSGFLLEHNGFRVALDLGYGTLPRLLDSLGSVSADGLDAVVIETVFAIPGVGSLMVQSVFRRDYPVIQGTLIVVAAMYVFINLLIDMLYVAFDPRISYE